MKAYKGFDKELKCRDFQYEIGKDYEEKESKLCEKGFHACEYPLDVFSYYPPSDSRYCEVEMNPNGEKSDDSKVCSNRIHIGAEIGINGIINAGVQFILDRTRNKKKETGNWSAATNTGHWSAATNTGHWSAATNTGKWSAATNTGHRSAATVAGEESIAIVTGYHGKAKGKLGCWLVITERNEHMHIMGIQAVLVDGKDIKEDVFYTMVDGKIQEAD